MPHAVALHCTTDGNGSATILLNKRMPRINRVDVGGEVYHVLNRANARVQIFDNNDDYQQFEETLEEAVEKYEMRLLAYSIMPNHWHLVLYPKQDGDLQKFMSWLSNTHTRRWHVTRSEEAKKWWLTPFPHNLISPSCVTLRGSVWNHITQRILHNV